MQIVSPVLSNFKMNYSHAAKENKQTENVSQKTFVGMPRYNPSFGMARIISYQKHPEIILTDERRKKVERLHSLLSNPEITEQDLKENVHHGLEVNEMQYLLNLGIRGENKKTFAKNYFYATTANRGRFTASGADNIKLFLNTKDLKGDKAVEIFADDKVVMEKIFELTNKNTQVEILKDRYSYGNSIGDIIKRKENSEELKKVINRVINDILANPSDISKKDIMQLLKKNESILDEENKKFLEDHMTKAYHSMLSDPKTDISETESILKDFITYQDNYEKQRLIDLGINGKNKEIFAKNYLNAIDKLYVQHSYDHESRIIAEQNVQRFIDATNLNDQKAPEIYIGNKDVMEKLFGLCTEEQQYKILTDRYSEGRTLAEILEMEEKSEETKKFFNRVLYKLSALDEDISRKKSQTLLYRNMPILDEQNKLVLEALNDPNCDVIES